MGKYIKRFNNINAQTTFINSINYIEPHVSCVVGSSNLKYNAPFVAIQVASSAYIKSSELNKFLEEVIGVHVYSNTTCKTFVADGEYSVILNGINNYYESLPAVELEEGEEPEWAIPAFASFTVENGAISLYTEEQEEYPEEPVEEEDSIEAFKVRVILDPGSNIPTPSYISCDGYGEESENFALNTVVDTGVHRPSCDSLTFQAEINGIYVSSSISYLELQPYPTVNDVYIYEGAGGNGYYFDLAEPTEPVEEEPEEPLTYIELGYLSTDSSKKAYISVSDEDNVYQSNPTIYAYSDTQLEMLAVNGSYVGDWGNVVSFNIANGLISDIEVNEAPAEEEDVMPADDMDPDSGGGEDIVEEEDPTPTDPPLEEVPEIIE